MAATILARPHLMTDHHLLLDGVAMTEQRPMGVHEDSSPVVPSGVAISVGDKRYGPRRWILDYRSARKICISRRRGCE